MRTLVLGGGGREHALCWACLLYTSIFGPVMEGIAEACSSCGCDLLGGETAEMPGVYDRGMFDLAGFAVGIVEEDKIIDGRDISKGDLLLGLPSSGLHSNGFSLVRKCLLNGRRALALDHNTAGYGKPLSEVLMEPTRLYVTQALKAASSGAIGGMAHITGGGLEENIARMLPATLKPSIDYASWERPPIFDLIKERGVDEVEMRRVFNLGIGFVMAVKPRDEQRVISLLAEMCIRDRKGPIAPPARRPPRRDERWPAVGCWSPSRRSAGTRG